MSRTASNILSYAVDAALLVPNFAIEVRRLHDAGKSGWWALGSVLATLLMLYSTIAGVVAGLGGNIQAGNALIGFGFLIAFPICIVLIIFWCRPSVGANQWGAPARPIYRR